MNSFFSTEDRVETLLREASEWIDTPFFPNACVKGHGVSCQKLVGALMRSCGFDIWDIPDGPMDWHGGGSLIEAHIDSVLAGRFKNILGTSVGGGSPLGCADDPRSLHAGDIVGFWVHSSVQHVGVMLGSSEFIHVLRHSSVAILRIEDPTWANRLARVWRPIE